MIVQKCAIKEIFFAMITVFCERIPNFAQKEYRTLSLHEHKTTTSDSNMSDD